MSRTSVESMQTVDSLARALYRRARLSGPDFSDIAVVVRSLHTCLKHLRVEAEDPDSLLNATQQEHSIYARQLGPIVEECDFTLKQLDTILEKYGGSSADTPSEAGPPRDGYIIGTADSREKDMIALIRTKLANQKTNIDIFLDTVQLHNPAKARQQFVDNPQSQQLDSIKDKVDAIAARLASRRVANISAGEMEEEELWQQFSTELEKEGFSSQVLMRNKEVLRAYIREMDSNGLLDQDHPPSVRGLLPAAGGRRSRGLSMSITPYPSDNRQDMSPKEVISPPMTANEKFLPSVKLNRGPPDYNTVSGTQSEYSSPEDAHGGFSNHTAPRSRAYSYSQNQIPQPQSAPPHRSTHAPYPYDPLESPSHYDDYAQQRTNTQKVYRAPISYNPPLPAKIPHRQNSRSDSGVSDSDSACSDSNNSLALISTRDLMQLDHGMAAMHLGPPQPSHLFISPGTSPNGPGGRYLPPPPVGDQVLNGAPGSPASLPPYSSPTSSVALAAKPPPPAYGSSPAPVTNHQQQQRVYSRLQPDSQGNEIPLEATWTKIRRTLVSPEVLDRAGVRYEARPDFVAVLGVLSREQIAHFAHESDEVRRLRRYGGQYYAPPRFTRGGSSEIRGNGARYNYRDEKSRSGSTSESDSILWDTDSSSDDGSRERERRPYGGRAYREGPEKEKQAGGDTREKNSNEQARDDKGTKVYPFVLPLAAAAAKGLDGKATTLASTVPPKPILKNKNENHVRFDREGPIEISPEEMAADKKRREQQRRERDRDRDREREKERRRRERDRDRDRDRDGDRRDYYSHGSRYGHHRHSSSMDARRHGHYSQGAEPSRDRDSSRREKKKAWGQTLGAAGIGGAAASLLSVLTEAATGF